MNGHSRWNVHFVLVIVGKIHELSECTLYNKSAVKNFIYLSFLLVQIK